MTAWTKALPINGSAGLEESGVFLRGGARPPTSEVVAFVDAHKDNVVEARPLGVEPICSLSQVAPCTSYAAKDRARSARAISDAVLIPELV